MSAAVLVVDDSLTVRMDLLQAFEGAGVRCVTCGTAREAREVLAREAIGLVVLDVQLPDADGVEFLKELRGDESPAPRVMLLSTEAAVRDRLRGLQTGADDYVGKPYDGAYVVARAKELLARRPKPEATADRAVILVIDDSATFRNVLRHVLERAAYEVLLASSGEEGLRVAGANPPTAILVDGVMPGIDGAGVIRRIRLDAALRGTPCILMTASDEREAELRALDAGADAFVRKDEAPDVVLARLSAALRRAAPAGTEAPSLLGPKRVLMLDDDEAYTRELSNVLRGESYDVVGVRSQREALEILRAQSFDCILLGPSLPVGRTRETCLAIKASPAIRDLPLVVLSLVQDDGAMLEALAAGADDFIPRASDVDVLKARVRAQLRRKQFEDERRRVREELLRRELEAANERIARRNAETKAALADELERKNKELEAFSYSVSHDLRAPLRVIDGFSHALLEEAGDKLDARARDYLKRVRTAAQRMGELIEDLLNLSRITRQELQLSRVDLTQLAQAIAAELRRREPSRVGTFHIAGDLHARADERLVRILLENVLGNAWKFTSRTPEPRIHFGAEMRDGRKAFFVRDNGAGFDVQYAGRLFGPFQRMHRADEFPGTGVGLATVQRIADRHGGRVWAESAVGKGTTIYFTLGESAVDSP